MFEQFREAGHGLARAVAAHGADAPDVRPAAGSIPAPRCWEKPVATRWPDGGEIGGSEPVRYEHAALARLSSTVRSAGYKAALVNVPWNLIPSPAQ